MTSEAGVARSPGWLKTGEEELVDSPFDSAVLELCQQRPDVIVLTADLAKAIGITLVPKLLPKQFVQVGMAEQNLMAIAGGLAKSGFIPIATTFAAFATRRAYDQIVISMGTGPSRGVVVGFTPGITNPARIHHQSIDDLAMMRAVPGCCVIDPADATEFASALAVAVDHEKLVYMRGHRGLVPRLFDQGLYRFRLGAVHVLRDGGGVGLISTGHASQWALEASRLLAERHVRHSILHVPCLKPVDRDSLLSFCEERGAVVTIENHSIIGGLGSLVAESLAEAGSAVRLRRLGVADRWPPGGSLDFIRGQLGLDAEGIAAAVLGAAQ